MKPQLNHLVVHVNDRDESAGFLAKVLGLDPPVLLGPFAQVETGNGVGIDFVDASSPGFLGSVPDDTPRMHLAFQVTEREFDEIFGRIKATGVEYWAHPGGGSPGEINRMDGGRGVYFADPTGHSWEILTRPYGSGPMKEA